MKANEFRIGNLLMSNGIVYNGKVMSFARFNESFDVVFFCNGNEYGMGEHFKDLSPIPLTEEWLLKFGFEKYFYEENGLKLPWYKLHKNDCLFDIDYEFAYTRDDGGYIKLQHVHQLQNLYFALTGEELETKSINTQNK